MIYLRLCVAYFTLFAIGGAWNMPLGGLGEPGEKSEASHVDTNGSLDEPSRKE